MKLFKKAKELFDRLKGDDRNQPPAAPAADPFPTEVTIPADPRYKYRLAQRDFEARAKAMPTFWNSMNRALGGQGTRVAGRNAAKRSKRARIEPGFGRRWKKGGVGEMDIAVSA